MNSPPVSPPPDPSALCRACGLCCGWAMFGSVGLRGEQETGWARRHRLPILAHEGDPCFRLPCSVLRAEGDRRVCGDYEHRPSVCRAFRCKLLVRYERGEVPLDGALAAVARARTLVESIERRVGSREGRDLAAELQRLSDLLLEKGAATPNDDIDTMLDLGVLRSMLQRDFLDENKDSGGASKTPSSKT